MSNFASGTARDDRRQSVLGTRATLSQRRSFGHWSSWKLKLWPILLPAILTTFWDSVLTDGQASSR